MTIRWAVIAIAVGCYMNFITLAVPVWPESPPAGTTPGGLGWGLLAIVMVALFVLFGLGLPAWFAWLAYRGSRAAVVMVLVCFAVSSCALLAGVDVLVVVHAVLWAGAFILLVLPESRRYARRQREVPRPDEGLARAFRVHSTRRSSGPPRHP